MSEEMENKPTQAPAAPFRRRRPSRRRSGRRNEGRGPGNSNQSGEEKPGRTDGPDILEQDDSREAERRREDAAQFVESTRETDQNRTSDERERGSGESANGEQPPR